MSQKTEAILGWKRKAIKNQTKKRRKDNKTLSQKNEKGRIKTRKKTLKKGNGVPFVSNSGYVVLT
jgi:hypothetical protein